MTDELNPVQRRALRALAHHLQPVVTIGGAGLTPAVLREIDVNLVAHELIKIRVFDEREQRNRLLTSICTDLGALPVQHIGKLLVIYRPAPEPAAPAPKPARRPSVRRRPADATAKTAKPVREPARRGAKRPAAGAAQKKPGPATRRKRVGA